VKQFFFEKKNQKTFVLWRARCLNAHASRKKFLLLFQKEALAYFTV